MVFNKKLIILICIIHSLRMFGLFSILPVLSLYTNSLKYSSSLLSAIALGSYGFSQCIFQFIFGCLSDKYGRKNLILIGLILFFFGSVISYFSDTIYLLIIGRIIQGSGAIGSVINALLIDNYKQNYIVRAFTFIGITIFITFIIAILLGPYINKKYGISTIFFIMIITSIICIFLVYLSDINNIQNNYKNYASIKFFVLDKNINFYFASFILHFVLTSNFINIPRILHHKFSLQSQYFYIFTIFISLLLVIYLIKIKKINKILIFKIALFNHAIMQILFHFLSYNYSYFFLIFTLYFTSFIIIEAYIPYFLAKNSINNRGMIMGLNSSIQYLGIFLGGFIGEIINYKYDLIFLINFFICFIYFFVFIKKVKS